MGLVLLFIKLIFLFQSFNTYTYIDSIIYDSDRYSLWEVYQLVIFKHGLSYANYQKVEVSQVSLNVSNGNMEDIYIWFIYR